MNKKAFVALTGASGIIYGAFLLKALDNSGIKTFACATHQALDNAEAERGKRYHDISAYLTDMGVKNTVIFDEYDMSAPVASGSCHIDYYIAAPASMGYCGRVASGISSNLPERCADVALKERRPLVIMFRETPLSSVHLENLLKLSKYGAVIMPASPAFYGRPASIDAIADFMAGRVLDVLGIENNLYERWTK